MDKHGDLDVFKEGYDEFGYKVHYCMTTVQILNRDEVLDVFPEFKGDKNIVIS